MQIIRFNAFDAPVIGYLQDDHDRLVAHRTRPALVICAGGAYRWLSPREKDPVALRFAALGYQTFLIEYSVREKAAGLRPLRELAACVAQIRHNAEAWHINPQDVGIMGFSAGGHLASTVATHATGDAKPNFQILFYPVISMEQGTTHQGSRDNLLGKAPKRKLVNQYSGEQHITKHTPRCFLALANDDRVVIPLNSVGYYEQLYTHGVPASMHIYPTGGHGFGIRQSFAYHLEMMLALKAWLRSF